MLAVTVLGLARVLGRPLAVGVAVVALACSSTAPSATPAAAPATEVASTAEPTLETSPEATPAASPAVATPLEAIEARVEGLRGLAPTGLVTREFVSDEELFAIIEQEVSAPAVLESFGNEGALLIQLGLLPPEADTVALYRALLDSQVLGLYDTDTRTMYVRAGDADVLLQEVTYSHEYVHALQDAHFDLDALDIATANRDASYALSALIEGDASLTQSEYLQGLGLGAALQLLGAAIDAPTPDTTPPVMIELLTFPYRSGLGYVAALAREGGSPAIDGAFARPPASTEHVLHPEKYAAAEPPVEVTPAFEALGGWAVEDTNVLGELTLALWLRLNGLPSREAATAAAGWGGDRYAVLEGADGASALVAVVAWDTPLDAAEFARAVAPDSMGAMGEAQSAGFGGRALVLVEPSSGVSVLALADDEGVARALAEELAATLAP